MRFIRCQRRRSIPWVAFFLLATFGLYMVLSSDKPARETKTNKGQRCTRVDHYNANDFNCVRPTINKTKADYVVCVHASTDFVSRYVLEAEYESHILLQMQDSLSAYPGALFIDIGGFIGTHALFAASIGYHTVVVEPFPKNLKLLEKSIDLNCFRDLITVVPNCLSDERGIFRFVVQPSCLGCAFVASKVEGENAVKNPSTELECLLVDDVAEIASRVSPAGETRRVAILKVDVEGFQSKVFTTSTASLLFEKFDIPIIFMEWAHQNQRSNPKSIEEMVRFFVSRGYVALEFCLQPNHVARLKPNAFISGWPHDIVWMKASAVGKFVERKPAY